MHRIMEVVGLMGRRISSFSKEWKDGKGEQLANSFVIELLKKQYKALPVFYKECELDAFQDIKNMIVCEKHK